MRRRQRKLANQVVGIGRKKATLAHAEQLGAIDRGTTDLPAGVRDADLIIVCTPVDLIAPQVIELARCCPQSAIITDAGSTKQSIVESIEKHASKPRFVGSHPL